MALALCGESLSYFCMAGNQRSEDQRPEGQRSERNLFNVDCLPIMYYYAYKITYNRGVYGTGKS